MVLRSGQFRITHIRDIGAGGLGRVDLVEVIASNNSYAIGTRFARKRMGIQWQRDAGAALRFEREIEVAQQLKHRHIVAFKGQNLAGGERYYLMPVYPRSLRDWLSEHRRCDWRTAANFCATIADAMAYAHNRNVFHRDLKPENILLDDDGCAMIADWGLGQFIHKHSKVLNLTVGGLGTQYYCALEQWGGGSSDHRADIYSLGMMLAELVSGGQVPIPYVGSGITNDVVVTVDYGTELLNQAVRKMTFMLPLHRYQSMYDVANALRTAAAMPAGRVCSL